MWYASVGYEDLAEGLEPIRNGEIFWMNKKTEVFEREGKGISEPTLLPHVRSSVQYRFWKGILGIRYLTRNMVRVSGKRKIYSRDTVLELLKFVWVEG